MENMETHIKKVLQMIFMLLTYMKITKSTVITYKDAHGNEISRFDHYNKKYPDKLEDRHPDGEYNEKHPDKLDGYPRQGEKDEILRR